MLNGKKLIDNVNPKILVCLIITKSIIDLEQSLFFYNVYVLKLQITSLWVFSHIYVSFWL